MGDEATDTDREHKQNKLMSVKWIHLVLNIRGISGGWINSWVVNVNPVSGREAGRRNKDLEGYCICFWYCADIWRKCLYRISFSIQNNVLNEN